MEQKSTLVRGLTLVTLFTLITGAMVGMAWAVLANVLLDRAGPAVIISLLIAAVLTLFIGLCFAELCSAMPYAGGEYIYVKRGLGKFPGFIAGWVLILAYGAMMPGECIIIGKLINGLIPAWSPTLIGVSAAVLFTLINLIGIRFSGLVQLALTFTLFGGILVYAFAGIPNVQLENFEPFFGRGTGGILMMIPIGMLAFMGYDVLPQVAEEVDAPIRKMVFIIPVSIFFVAIIYILVMMVSAGLVPWEQIAKSTEHIPIIPSVVVALGEKGPVIIIIAGVCGLVTTMNAFLIGGSRLLMAMAKDNELPSAFKKIHPRFNVPYVGIIFLGILGIAGSFIKELIVLFDTAASSVLVGYLLVAITLITLRRREPDMERPYRVPGYPVIPIIAIVAVVPTWLISLVILKPWALGVFFGWIVVGCVYYLLVRKGRV